MPDLPLAALGGLVAALAVWFLARRLPWLRFAEAIAAGIVAICALGYPSWEWSRLLYLPVGMGVGVLAYAVSIVIVGNRHGRALAFIRHSPSVLLAGLSTPSIAVRYVFVVALEELIFRGYLQGRVLGGGLLGVAVASIAFVLIHLGPNRGLEPADLADLLLFALMLGVLYELTASLPLVFGIHLVRNLATEFARRQLAMAGTRAAALAGATSQVTP